MTWHPYQLNSVMFDQLHEGMMAVPDQFRGDLIFAKCLNCSSSQWIEHQSLSGKDLSAELEAPLSVAVTKQWLTKT
jgi:hypothetical protein